MNRIIDNNIESRIWSILIEDADFGPELKNLLEIGELIWQRGWAESNAGNVSLRLPDSIVERVATLCFTGSSENAPQGSMPDPGDFIWLLVSATGSRYREFKKLGFESFVLLSTRKLSDDHKHKADFISFPSTRKPTSECLTHVAAQQWLQNFRPVDKVVLHAHLTDWIVISSLAEYEADKHQLSESIISCLPEVQFYLPNGFKLLPYSDPGSEELAIITEAALIQTNIVVWEKHGIVVTADSINKAFDYLEVMAKAAKVYLKLR